MEVAIPRRGHRAKGILYGSLLPPSVDLYFCLSALPIAWLAPHTSTHPPLSSPPLNTTTKPALSRRHRHARLYSPLFNGPQSPAHAHPLFSPLSQQHSHTHTHLLLHTSSHTTHTSTLLLLLRVAALLCMLTHTQSRARAVIKQMAHTRLPSSKIHPPPRHAFPRART